MWINCNYITYEQKIVSQPVLLISAMTETQLSICPEDFYLTKLGWPALHLVSIPCWLPPCPGLKTHLCLVVQRSFACSVITNTRLVI